MRKIDETLTKFFARNFAGIGPDKYVKTMEGNIIPMSESGLTFSNSENITDCNLFFVTALFGVFNVTKNLIVVPKKFTETLEIVSRTGVAPPGFEGGRVYQNRSQRLPSLDSFGIRLSIRSGM